MRRKTSAPAAFRFWRRKGAFLLSGVCHDTEKRVGGAMERPSHHGSRNTKRVSSVAMLCIAFLSFTLQACVSAPNDPIASHSAYYNDDMRVIEKVADNIVAQPPDLTQSYDSLGFECGDVLQAAGAVQSSDSARASKYIKHGIQIANFLLAHDDENHDGKPGWGPPDPWDAFNDGTVNPANQELAYDDATVGYCLIQAYLRTGGAQYLNTLITVLTNYQTFWHAYTTRVDPRCSNCGYFWYSTNTNDFGRFVKNTNMLMGWDTAEVARITHSPSLTTLARQVFNSEQYEINVRHNFNYLGYDDPHYSEFLDAHIVYEIWGYRHIARNLSLSNYQHTLVALQDAFLSCGDACGADTSYGPSVDCELAGDNPSSKARCQQFVSHPDHDKLGGQLLLAGLVDALPSL